MPSDDAKPVKKRMEVEVDDGDETCLGAILENRKKKHTATLVSKSNVKEAQVKRETPQDFDSDKPVKTRPKGAKVKTEDEDDEDIKPILKKTSGIKPDKDSTKKKKKEEEKKERKVYDLPGQKRETPQERDPLRIFYETLLQQVPSSEMAQVWMMESGLLPKEVAMKVFEKKRQKQGQRNLSSPAKSVKKTVSSASNKKTPSSPAASNKKKSTNSSKPSKKRKIVDESSDEDSDDDFIINRPTKKKRAT